MDNSPPKSSSPADPAWTTRAAELKEKLMAKRKALKASSNPTATDIATTIKTDQSTNNLPSSHIQNHKNTIQPSSIAHANGMADTTEKNEKDSSNSNSISNIQQDITVRNALLTAKQIPPTIDLQFVLTSDLIKALESEQKIVKALQGPLMQAAGNDNIEQKIRQGQDTVSKLQQALKSRETTGITLFRSLSLFTC